MRAPTSFLSSGCSALDSIDPTTSKAVSLSEPSKPSSEVLMAATEAVITAIMKVPDIALTCNHSAHDSIYDCDDAVVPCSPEVIKAAHDASPDACMELPEKLGLPWTSPLSQEYIELAAIDAARSGNLHLLAWLHSQRIQPLSQHICFEAILQQQVSVLEWLRLNGPPWPWGTDACVAAVLSRGTESLQWLLAQESSSCRQQDLSACVDAAAIAGCWSTLQWLLDTYPATLWDFGKACWWAIKGGRLDMLQWMSAQVSRQEFNIRAELLCRFALQHGRTDVLEWLCTQAPACLPLILRHVTANAADLMRGRHDEALAWLHAAYQQAKEHCKMSSVTEDEAGPVPEVWDTAALCYHAVAVGSLEGLQLVKPQSLGMRTHDWDMLCKRSLQYGYQEIAQWLHGQDPESWFWTCGHACTLAARYGFLHILRWLSTAAPPGPDDIGPCTEAAARGRLAILQWARAAGYAWDESTYVAAAAVPGNLEMLEWMAAQDPPCPVNNAALMVCARDGDSHMFRWALQQPQIVAELSRPFVPHNLPAEKHGRLLPLMAEAWVPESDTETLLENMQQCRFAFYACAKRLAKQACSDIPLCHAESCTEMGQAEGELHSPADSASSGQQDQQQQLDGNNVSASNLGSLPPDILCKIACDAQIDFAWMHAEGSSPAHRRMSCSGPCCFPRRRPLAH